MFRHVPNALTTGRLLLAGIFFALLSLYQHGGRGDPWLLEEPPVLGSRSAGNRR